MSRRIVGVAPSPVYLGAIVEQCRVELESVRAKHEESLKSRDPIRIKRTLGALDIARGKLLIAQADAAEAVTETRP